MVEPLPHTARHPLTLETLRAALPALREGLASMWARTPVPATDPKSLAMFAERTLHRWLQTRFDYRTGSSANGLDFPDVPMDFKLTDAARPQSSIPAAGRHEMLWGLGYHVLVAIYQKSPRDGAIYLALDDLWCLDAEQTADRRTTEEVQRLVRHDARDGVLARYLEQRLPFCRAEEARVQVARIRAQPPVLGQLTLSPAMQYRATYNGAWKDHQATQRVPAPDLWEAAVE